MALQLASCATGRSALMLNVPQHTVKPEQAVCPAENGDKQPMGIDLNCLFLCSTSHTTPYLTPPARLLLQARFASQVIHTSHAHLTQPKQSCSSADV